MSLAETDWQRFLSPDSNLPPDVLFRVKDEEGEGGQSKTIAAHRFLLGGVSSVFEGMFFGPVKETGEVVEVKETTFEAFDTMIKYIYNPPAGDPFNLDEIGCPQKLFELLTLANKYQLAKLTTIASDALESHYRTVMWQTFEVFCSVSQSIGNWVLGSVMYPQDI